jgi:hypothetical protein
MFALIMRYAERIRMPGVQVMLTPQMPLSSLTLGGYGWTPSDWLKAFYPDDLPLDWQVSYYANEFNSVVLPAGGWGQVLLQARFWSEEVNKGFCFYPEITQDLLHVSYWDDVGQVMDGILSEKIGGLLVHADVVPDLPASWLGKYPLHTLQSGQWLADSPEGSELQLGILRAIQPLDPLALRNVFEQLLQAHTRADVLLFVDIPWTSVEQLRLMQQFYGICG